MPRQPRFCVYIRITSFGKVYNSGKVYKPPLPSHYVRIFVRLMRDLVWTLIIIWLAWQFVNIFRGSAAKRQRSSFEGPRNQKPSASERQRKLDTEGEYVDFEESK